MIVNILAAVFNIPLDYCLINGVGVFPDSFINLFRSRHDPGEDFSHVAVLGTHLLQYVAALTFVDAIGITFMGSLKGAGDTRFIMLCMLTASAWCMVVPLCLFLHTE
jgi:MATE family multidrug resistance protein